jgi:fimbrial chaperone protein
MLINLVMTTPKILFNTLILLCAALLSSNLLASSFGVKPTRIFVQTLPQSSMSVTNQGDTTVYIQAELLKWTQQKGSDIYAPARDVIVSPPMFKIEPGEMQIVRLHSMLTDGSNQERTYRVILQELPSPSPDLNRPAVATILRMSIPIFILPPDVDPPQVNWKATRTENGLVIRAKNTSNSHIQLTSLKLVDGDDKVLRNQKIFVYILAGQSYRWHIKLPDDWTSDSIKLSANSDRDKLYARVSISEPAP